MENDKIKGLLENMYLKDLKEIVKKCSVQYEIEAHQTDNPGVDYTLMTVQLVSKGEATPMMKETMNISPIGEFSVYESKLADICDKILMEIISMGLGFMTERGVSVKEVEYTDEVGL